MYSHLGRLEPHKNWNPEVFAFFSNGPYVYIHILVVFFFFFLNKVKEIACAIINFTLSIIYLFIYLFVCL